MSQFALFSDPLEVAFVEFDKANPHVWYRFCEIAGEMIDAGRDHYSADAICHVIRYEHDRTRSDDGFKLNNNHVALYARKWLNTHPSFPTFFRTRRRKS